VIQQGGLVDGAGVVVQAPGDGQVHGEILRRDAEVRQIPDHRVQLLKTLVEDFVPAPVALQSGENGVVSAGDGDKLQDLVGVGRSHGEVAGEDGLHLFRPDFVQLVYGAHDVAGFLRQAQHGVEAVEDLPVVHPDLEPLQSQGGEGLVDDGGDLCLIDDGEPAISDDVDVRLIELPEAAPLGPLTPVHLADLIPAEREGQVVVVEGHILCQGDRQVEPECQIRVALLEAVDLLLRLAAALGQQYLAGLDHRGVQGGKAIEGIGTAEDLHDPLHLLLWSGQQFHKAGQCPWGHFSHRQNSFFVGCGSLPGMHRGRKMIKRSRPAALGRERFRFVVPPKFKAYRASFLPPVLRGGCRGRLRPRSAAVLRPGRPGRSQRCAPLCGAGDWSTAAASARCK
jgi:hypothetical protein